MKDPKPVRGRPPVGRIIEVRLPEEHLKMLEAIQRTEGAKSRAEAIRAAIEHYPYSQRRKGLSVAEEPQ